MVISLIRSCGFMSPLKLIFVMGLSTPFALPGVAQEAGYVDARGISEPRRTDKLKKDMTPGQCGDNCRLERPFSFQLIKMDLGPGSVD
ncbi:hypothetical protein HDF16_006366 [Granulicella aggregans]|uniref:Uncharacterized protein n=1 Tax=Granulicella aggregans TaxID=474949 RepID=A0A7W7ZKJ7_9BACT|nr:hypothetical protein [Granulicella aggregans]